jgi:hypothetical protein
MDPEYIHLIPDGSLPDLTGHVFRAVVIVETAITAGWREKVSAWLVKNGCLYMMAWGQDCSLWDDSVDHANLDEFNYGDIPGDRFVMTTWHDKEPLQEVFWFCEHTASHPTVDLNRIILVHISPIDRKSELLGFYQDAGQAS